MARKSKLRPAQIRRIYRSTDTAKALADRYGVSQPLVYLIRSGRVHYQLTKGLKRDKKPISPRSAKEPPIDAIALADAIIDQLMKRLRTL